MLPTKYKTKYQLIYNLIIEPLIESTEHLKKIQNINTLHENKITEHITRYLQYYSKFKKLYQTSIIARVRPKIIYDEDPNNEPDLEITLFNTSNTILFEAKRINKKPDLFEYCGKNGIKRFTTGYYPVKDYCGMLGYVQNNNIKNVVYCIKTQVKEINFQKLSDISEQCFLSFHNLPKNLLQCFHVILKIY